MSEMKPFLDLYVSRERERERPLSLSFFSLSVVAYNFSGFIVVCFIRSTGEAFFLKIFVGLLWGFVGLLSGGRVTVRGRRKEAGWVFNFFFFFFFLK